MAIVIDQANVGEFTLDSASSTIALTTSNAVASGATIILTASFASGVTASSCSGGGLTWTIDKQGTGASSSSGAIISAYAPSGLASGTTITLTLSGSTTGGRSLCGTSFTGVATSTPVDVAGTAQSNAGVTSWSTGALTIAAGSVLVGLGVGFTSNFSSTPTSPSIETHDVNGGAGSFDATTAYRIEASGGSVAVAGTWSSAQSGVSMGVAYKVAAGGGTTKSIVTAAITASSAVTGSVQALKHITGASITATSAVSGSVTALKHIVTAAVSATSAVTGSLRALRAVLPASVTATSAVTGSLRALHAIAGAAANATSSVTGAITGGAVASVIENVRDYFASVFHYHGH